MQFFYLLFNILCFIAFGQCKSILEQNDTALELLNNCKCVEKDFCYNGHINIRGVGIITLRNEKINDTETVEIRCSGPSFICCKGWKDQFETRADQTLSSYKTEENTTSSSTNKELFRKEKVNQKCGRAKPMVNIRIHADPEDINIAMDGEFPWIASIHRRNSLDGTFQFRCAGSLISESVVLTAAHCVYSLRKKPSDMRVLADAKKELKVIRNSISEEGEIKKIIVHPDYYSGGAHNDIALIFLKKNYNESKELNSICLPDFNATYDSSRCLVAGWGIGNLRTDDGVKMLSKVEVPLVEREKCQTLLRDTKLGANFELHESSICAGGQRNKDACKGDGGGPLICPNEEGYFIQVGIVSWGVECSKENVPGVYTNVEKFSKWIRENVDQI